MDIGTLMQMIDELFQDKDRVSKQEVVQKAQSPGIGDDIRQAARELPEGHYTKSDLQARLADMAGVGGGIGGMLR